jgi:hypothetical protein
MIKGREGRGEEGRGGEGDGMNPPPKTNPVYGPAHVHAVAVTFSLLILDMTRQKFSTIFLIKCFGLGLAEIVSV